MTAPNSVSGPDYDVFFSALRAADEEFATSVALNLLDAGTPPRQVLLNLVGAAQREVGARWQSGTWSVAEEHAATAINEQVVRAIGSRTRLRAGERGHVLLGCVEGEWHLLPALLVAEVLRLDGWRVDVLGASVSAETLVARIHRDGPDLVALSCSLAVHLPAAHRAITAARQTGTPVLVGGPGFGADGRWARRLGADVWAGDADQAAALLAERLPAMPVAARTNPPLDSGEHAGLCARRTTLLKVAGEAVDTDGAGTGTSDPGVEDELGHLLDYLAAAVFVGDTEPFLDQVDWQLRLLADRRVPAPPLRAVLRAVRSELHDFPFAQSCLDQALGAVEASLEAGPHPGPAPDARRGEPR
jgi:methanogenic corrinoid protein MtbC1